MEGLVGSGLSPGGCIVRKKRSIVSHKPRLDHPKFSLSSDILPPFAHPFGKGNIEKNQNSEKVVLSDGLRSENMPKKLKLKFGGVTRTIHTKLTEDFSFGGGSSIAKSSSSFDAFKPKLKSLPQDDIGDNHFSSDGKNVFGIKQKVHVKINSSSKKEFSSKGKIFRERAPMDNELVRKRKRVCQRRVLDDEDEVDGFHGKETGEYKPSRPGKDGRKKSRLENLYKDKGYLEEEEDEEELTSDGEPESNGKKMKQGSISLILENHNQSAPTTRNRALQSGKDNLIGPCLGFLGLQNDLLPAPSRRKKEKISEVDKQLKKVEAAQRRKFQMEKAAKEAEAEAIRKILGQDSKKKKEEKLKQRRDELIQGRTGSDATLSPNTVRWVIGPNGTTVTFSDDIGLPGIFNPVTCSYPPPREKCAGPNCTNAYKYRDSKSKVPLCSLHCYKAVTTRKDAASNSLLIPSILH